MAKKKDKRPRKGDFVSVGYLDQKHCDLGIYIGGEFKKIYLVDDGIVTTMDSLKQIHAIHGNIKSVGIVNEFRDIARMTDSKLYAEQSAQG